jgi:hypothetical protein
MSNSQTVRADWLEMSISELLECHATLIAEFPYALITYLDSSDQVFTLPTVQSVIEESGIVAKQFGSGLLMSGDSLLELVRTHSLFTGFDEVWFFHQYPEMPKPQGLIITAPVVITDGLPGGLVEWMRRSRCALGLGGGIGVNYVALEERDGRLLSQPCEDASRD